MTGWLVYSLCSRLCNLLRSRLIAVMIVTYIMSAMITESAHNSAILGRLMHHLLFQALAFLLHGVDLSIVVLCALPQRCCCQDFREAFWSTGNGMSPVHLLKDPSKLS